MSINSKTLRNDIVFIIINEHIFDRWLSALNNV